MSADTLQKSANASSHRSPTKIWANRLVVLSLIIILPLLRAFGVLDTDWTNRLGIILNFLAGFMLAPELIGLSRLRQIEEYLERLSVNLDTMAKEKLENYIESLRTRKKDMFVCIGLIVVMSMTMFLLTRDMYIEANILSAASLVGVLLVALTLYKEEIGAFIRERLVRPRWKNLLFLLVFIISGPIVFASSWLWMLLFGVFLVGMVAGVLQILLITYFLFPLFKSLSLLISSPLVLLLGFAGLMIKQIVKHLEGDEVLRGLLRWWGVLFFIIGNLLQFIATF